MTISLYRALAHRSEKLRTPEQCDVASRVLTLHHYWFRHVEMEVAVPEASLPQAVAIVAHLVAVCAGVADADFSHGVQAELRGVGLGPALDRTSGSYVHHYPVSFRSLRAEDTLLSVTSGSTTTWYTIGLFSYCRLVDLHRFRGFCDLVATALSLKCGGRCHWGKLQPSAGAPAMPMHPGVAPFDDFRRSVDPDGSFVSDAVTRAVGVPISGRP
jgi:hypothetical protein